VRRLLLATVNSWNGLRAAARSEEAFRQELWVFVLAVPLAYLIGDGLWQRVAMIGVVVLIMVVELLNTAIEKLSDHVTPHSHPAIGRIKDMGSAAVGLSLLLAGAVWLVALAERLAPLLTASP
jgi:diacylglycerol kinase (ATP)